MVDLAFVQGLNLSRRFSSIFVEKDPIIPYNIKISNAVSPLPSLIVLSAPFDKRYSMSGTLQVAHAHIRGV